MSENIEIFCPLCGKQGKIERPHPRMLYVTKCDGCEYWILYYNGRCFALDDQIMSGGTHEDRIACMEAALMDYFYPQLNGLAIVVEGKIFADKSQSGSEVLKNLDEFQFQPEDSILPEELDSFRNVDLKLLDNPEYFKAVFEL